MLARVDLARVVNLQAALQRPRWVDAVVDDGDAGGFSGGPVRVCVVGRGNGVRSNVAASAERMPLVRDGGVEGVVDQVEDGGELARWDEESDF